MKLLPAMKYWEISPSSTTPSNISTDQGSYRNKDAQCSEKQAGWDRASPAETWIGQSRSRLLQTSPSKLPGLSQSCHWSHWSLVDTQSIIRVILNFTSGLLLPNRLLVTTEWPWKDEGNQMGILKLIFSLSKAFTLSHLMFSLHNIFVNMKKCN